MVEKRSNNSKNTTEKKETYIRQGVYWYSGGGGRYKGVNSRWALFIHSKAFSPYFIFSRRVSSTLPYGFVSLRNDASSSFMEQFSLLYKPLNHLTPSGASFHVPHAMKDIYN